MVAPVQAIVEEFRAKHIRVSSAAGGCIATEASIGSFHRSGAELEDWPRVLLCDEGGTGTVATRNAALLAGLDRIQDSKSARRAVQLRKGCFATHWSWCGTRDPRRLWAQPHCPYKPKYPTCPDSPWSSPWSCRWQPSNSSSWEQGVLLQNGGFCNTSTLKWCIIVWCITKQVVAYCCHHLKHTKLNNLKFKMTFLLNCCSKQYCF
jgi:hypothetical protein